MRRSPDKSIFFLVLIFACGYVHAGSIVKRDDGSSGGLKGLLDGIKSFTSDFPLVGGLIGSVIDKLEQLWAKIQALTNGAVGRALGGALPCTIDLNDGIACSGVSSKSDIVDLVQSMLDPIPGLILPQFIKNLIIFAVDLFVAPAIDVLFGGVPAGS